MLGKLFIPGIIVAGFFLFTHQPDRPHTASAYVAQACDARGVSASFAWVAPGAGAEQAWVDLGLEPGFPLGWYQAHGPLPPSQNTFSVGGLTAGVTYYFRVNSLAGGKWKMEAKGSFVAACAALALGSAPPVDTPTLAEDGAE